MLKKIHKNDLDLSKDPTGKVVILNRLLRYLWRIGMPGLFNNLFHRQKILDFGSGTFNTLTVGSILYVNGCKEVVCFEPDKLNLEASENVKRTLKSMKANHDAYNFSGIPTDIFMNRLEAIPSDCMDKILQSKGSDLVSHNICEGLHYTNDFPSLASKDFNFIFSNLVLEHVSDQGPILDFFSKFNDGSCLQFHTVDFADHRFYKIEPQDRPRQIDRLFQFYRDGDDPSSGNDKYGVTNQLRASELEGYFRTKHLTYDVLETQLAPIASVEGLSLSKRFRNVPMEDLLVWVRVYAFH